MAAAELPDPFWLNYNGDFQTQIENILQDIRLTRTQALNLNWLIYDLENVLQELWPGCKVVPFGSLVTGLGLKNSDVDCFVSLPDNVQTPENKLVPQTRNYLRRYPTLFSELFAITGAKVPIVKFFHLPTLTNCDVSFKTPAGIRNSRLIYYLLHSDVRAFHLALLIKYWSKVHSLTGTNFLPNYALTMLVIFFLQVKEILPPVCDLQFNGIDGEYMVNNWNTSFIEKKVTTTNFDSLYELLRDFFEYYSKFQFKYFAVCPYIGRPIEKEIFTKSLAQVPVQYELYKYNVREKNCLPLRINTEMCVQDPFEHSRNCAVAVHPKLMKNIMYHIHYASYIFSNVPEDEVLQYILCHKDEAEDDTRYKNVPRNRLPTQNSRFKNAGQNKNIRHGRITKAQLKFRSSTSRFNRWR